MTITTAKLTRVISHVSKPGIIVATPGNEIALTFSEQLDQPEHCYMLDKGFVWIDDSEYVYRPRRRKPVRIEKGRARHP